MRPVLIKNREKASYIPIWWLRNYLSTYTGAWHAGMGQSEEGRSLSTAFIGRPQVLTATADATVPFLDRKTPRCQGITDCSLPVPDTLLFGTLGQYCGCISTLFKAPLCCHCSVKVLACNLQSGTLRLKPVDFV